MKIKSQKPVINLQKYRDERKDKIEKDFFEEHGINRADQSLFDQLRAQKREERKNYGTINI